MKITEKPNLSAMPLTVKINLSTMLLVALLWFGFSLYSVVAGSSTMGSSGFIKWIISALTLLVSLVLAATCYLLSRRYKPAWFFSLLLLLAMLVTGFMDELGLADYLFLILNAIPIVFLIRDRRWYCWVS